MLPPQQLQAQALPCPSEAAGSVSQPQMPPLDTISPWSWSPHRDPGAAGSHIPVPLHIPQHQRPLLLPHQLIPAEATAEAASLWEAAVPNPFLTATALPCKTPKVLGLVTPCNRTWHWDLGPGKPGCSSRLSHLSLSHHPFPSSVRLFKLPKRKSLELPTTTPCM